MGREVRRVPKDWEHPRNDDGSYRPMYDESHAAAVDEHVRFWKAWGAGDAEALKEWYAELDDDPAESAPHLGHRDDYMPDWPDAERTHLMMYETCSEGTPISPAFETAEELARWLADNRASAFGGMTATYEQWLATCRAGSAISMVMDSKGLRSGVEASEDA